MASTPLEKVSSRLQHLDSSSGSAKELVMPKSLLHQCQTHLWQILNPWQESQYCKHLKALWKVVSERGALWDGFVAEARGSVMSIGGAVWARLEVRFANWPWKLLAGFMMDEHGKMVVRLQAMLYARKHCCRPPRAHTLGCGKNKIRNRLELRTCL